MKLKTTLKQPAAPDSTRFAARYLDEIIDYGGEACTRADAILDMQSLGMTQPEIDRWLQGHELGRRIRRRPLELSIHLAATPKT
jgi:hypothetical protein